MSKQEIIDKYWVEFLKWGKKENVRLLKETGNGNIPAYGYNNYTEEAFWSWYVEEKL